jgi:hypothetical protein
MTWWTLHGRRWDLCLAIPHVHDSNKEENYRRRRSRRRWTSIYYFHNTTRTTTQFHHAEWKLFSNLYCVTDRYYDQISLQFYPRIQQPLHESQLPAIVAIQDESSSEQNQKELFQRQNVNTHVTVPPATTTVTTVGIYLD